MQCTTTDTLVNSYAHHSTAATLAQQNTNVGELDGVSILLALLCPTTRASAKASNWQNRVVMVAWWPAAALPLVCIKLMSSA